MVHVTLQDIFQAGFPAYEQTHPLPTHVRKASRAIMRCRTAALGGHVQACPDGHVSRIWYNSCKHRSCPQCAFLQIDRWLSKQTSRLLDCDHYHAIFTIPHDLNVLWLDNVPLLTSLLFTSVRDTLFALLGDPTYLGARPGIMAALHTWGQTLVLHPHIHCVVTGGGLTPEGHWVAVHNGYLLPGRVVMAVFRGKVLDALRRAFHRGVLALPGAMRPQQFHNLLNRLGHKKKTHWNVRIMERYPYGQGVATYLARSMRGGPIKNARLVSFEGHRVTFVYHNNHDTPEGGKGARQPMTLPVDDFLRRVLLHVPAPHTGGAMLWSVPSQQSRVPVGKPRPLGPAACGGSGASRLADVLCAARRGASGEVSDLWPTAGVHGDHTTWWCASGRTVRGARGMRRASGRRGRMSWDGCVLGQPTVHLYSGGNVLATGRQVWGGLALVN